MITEESPGVNKKSSSQKNTVKPFVHLVSSSSSPVAEPRMATRPFPISNFEPQRHSAASPSPANHTTPTPDKVHAVDRYRYIVTWPRRISSEISFERVSKGTTQLIVHCVSQSPFMHLMSRIVFGGPHGPECRYVGFAYVRSKSKKIVPIHTDVPPTANPRNFRLDPFVGIENIFSPCGIRLDAETP